LKASAKGKRTVKRGSFVTKRLVEPRTPIEG